MNADIEKNENWGTCSKCGEPVLVDPSTGKAEPCAMCASHASKDAGALGVGLLVVGSVAALGLIYYCVRLL